MCERAAAFEVARRSEGSTGRKSRGPTAEPTDSRIQMLRLIAAILVIVMMGTPLVAYLWETLNQLLAGQVDWTRLAISLPVLALSILLFRVMTRIAERLEVQPPESSPPPREH
jgi:hypothetical protein